MHAEILFLKTLPKNILSAALADLRNSPSESLVEYILSCYSEYLTEEQYQAGQAALAQSAQQDEETFDRVVSEMNALEW